MSTELYGILGSGTASKKVIHASLDDLGTEILYMVPWYGKTTEGLEHVYDWLLDNNAVFTMVASGKVPKVFMNCANDILLGIEDVDGEIIKLLANRSVKGMATILWEEDNERHSTKLAEACIKAGLPTLELTNGLVPIVFDDIPNIPVVEEDPTETAAEAPEDPVEEFDRETMENMPAAVVKRMAKDKGIEAKTKEQALDAMFGVTMSDITSAGDRHIVSVTVKYSDGTVKEL